MAAAAAVFGSVPAASAAPSDAPLEYCVVYLEQGPHAEPTCYDDPRELDRAMAQRLVEEEAGEAAAAADESATALASGVIAVHYDYTGFGGSYVNIVGDVCNGGKWYPSSSWNNRVSSTRNHCGTNISHYDASSCTGAGTTISGHSADLGWMSNLTSCVRYG